MVGPLSAVFNLLPGKLKHMVSEDMPLRAIATMGDSISFHDVHIAIYVAFITIIAAAAAITKNYPPFSRREIAVYISVPQL
jgi:hypothetical protein